MSITISTEHAIKRNFEIWREVKEPVITKCDRLLSLRATAIYYKVRQQLQFITKCDNLLLQIAMIITKCDRTTEELASFN